MNPTHEDKAYAQFDRRLLRRFLGYLGPHRRLVALSAALILAGVGLQTLSPLIVRHAIDGPVEDRDARGLAAAAGLFLGLAAIVTLLKYLEHLATSLAGQRMIRDLRLEVFGHLQRQPIAYFTRTPVGRLTTRLTNDIDALDEMFTSGLVWMVMDLALLAGYTAIMFVLSWRLTLLMFSLAPLVAVGLLLFRRYARDVLRALRQKIAALAAMVQELIAGMSVVQLFGQERRVEERFGERNQDFRRTAFRAVVVHSLFYPGAQLVGALAVALLIAYAAGAVGEGGLSYGTVVAFAYAANRFFGPIQDLAEKYTILQSAMAAAERLFGILDSPAEDPGGAVGAVARGAIEFDGVDFSYDGSTPVLQGVSFSVAPGERVALVGLTGAGKTTLAHLLERFYDPTGGSIRVDGVDVRRYERRALRRGMALVTQEPFLFTRTIRENIGGRAHEAAAAAQAHDFITALPDGYETPMAEGAATLSLGQRQLVSIARALATEARILILDEATASVDPQTERRIQAAMERLLAGRTALVIAHRLETVRRADRIVVLHHGRVRETGTHDELMAREGLYAQMVRLHLWEGDSASER
jgi:ATP-binding cassette subfamily B protein